VKRWTAVINHSRASGKPPQTAEFDWYEALQTYLSPDSEVVSIAIYGAVGDAGEAVPAPCPARLRRQPRNYRLRLARASPQLQRISSKISPLG
jgi:hypothetical protein